MNKREAFLKAMLPSTLGLVIVIVVSAFLKLHLNRLFLGGNVSSLCFQAAILVGLAAWIFVYLVRSLIGGFQAISVESWPRVVLAVIACGATSLTGYKLSLLLIRPADSWPRFGIYLITIPVFYLVFGWIALGFSAILDHGKAIAVVTDRYRYISDSDPRWTRRAAMTVKNHGEYAHFIGNSYANAYLVLSLMAAVSAIVVRV